MNRQQRRQEIRSARQAQRRGEPASNPPLAALFEHALRAHQAGALQQAEAAYRQVLTRDPTHAGAHANLGTALHDLGRPAEAVASYRRALRLRPDFPEAHNGLGAALTALGRPAEAEASCREALRLWPEFSEAHNNRGNALNAIGRQAEAEASYREALRLRPDFPEVHNNLGGVLNDLGRPAEAEGFCRDALLLWPDFPEAHNNLGNALRELGRPAEAEASYRAALRLRQGYPEALNNLGGALTDLGRPAEAEASCREALRLRPDYAEAHNNRALALRDLGRPVEAAASCREALRLRPDYTDARVNIAVSLLLAGQFEQGWKEYEWRWKTKFMAGSVRDFAAPLWRGDPIGGRTILLHAEQGLGDTLQFCRYAPLMEADARIILEVQAPLARLLSRLAGVSGIAVRGEGLPRFDLHCPLMSLPLAFGTTLETIPAATPYVTADPALAAAWRDRLVGLDGTRIGLVWAGGQKQFAAGALMDNRRSIALNVLGPLGEVSGASFVSLQKGGPSAEAADPPDGMVLHDVTADLHDFEDTAALIVNLDLVISVDTAVAHLAGALGKPVWLLNRFDTDWRWLLRRNDSPWYPTLRQFRQPSPGDWRSVAAAARDALHQLLAGDCDQLRARQAALPSG